MGEHLCEECAVQLQAPWQRVEPPVVTVPVFAAGAYGGARRSLVLALKEHLRDAAATVAGRIISSGILHVAGRGLIVDPRLGTVVLVPCPSRRHAARARGGDHMVKVCRRVAQLWASVVVADVSWLGEDARDSVGLSRAQRRANVAANIRFNVKDVAELRRIIHRVGRKNCSVVVVDDVCTTGATSAQFSLALAAAGVDVDAVLVVAAA